MMIPVQGKAPDGTITYSSLLDAGSEANEIELLRTVASGLEVIWGHDEFGWWAAVPSSPTSKFAAASGSSSRYALFREDDNGVRFLIAHFDSRGGASIEPASRSQSPNCEAPLAKTHQMRISIPVIALFCLSVVVFAQSSATPTTMPMPPKTLLIVSYAHAVDSVFYHGTVSFTDGVIRATWTYERDGKKVTEDGKVSDEDFETLWHTISDQDHFNKFVPTEPDAKIDPVGTHLVSIAFQTEGGSGRRMFAVPLSAEKEEWFSKWIVAIRGPWTWEKSEKP
jgi:hypothetical protein